MRHVILSVAAAVVLATAVNGCSTDPLSSEIADAIEAARGCADVTDCALVGSYCPFGCYIVVHQDKVEEVRELIESYRFPCQYQCLPMGEIRCVDDRCVVEPAEL